MPAALSMKAETPPRGALLPPLIVGCAGFMQAFDANAVIVALPAMAKGFATPPLALGIVITAYLVGAAAFLPLCGWAAERFGARRLFLAAIALFGLTSITCGVADTLPMLVLARFAQGCAGAMLLPVGRIIVLAHTPSGGMLRTMGLLTTPVMLGPLLGSPIGGLIVTFGSWRWLFFVNVPVALAGLLLVRAYVPDVGPRAARALDGRGMLLLSAALVGLTYGVSLAARPVSVLPGLALIAAGLAASFGYAVHARRHPHPIVAGGLFAIRSFAASNLGGLFPRLLVSAVPFLLALLFQVGFGLSAVQAGGLVVASALGSLPSRWLVSALLRRWSFRTVLAVNAVAVAATVAVCAALTPATPHLLIMALLFVQGLLRSLQLVTLMALGYADIEPVDLPAASTIASLSQQIAMSLGIALAVPAVEMGRAFRGGVGLGPTAIAPAFLLLAALSLVSMFWFLRLPADAGDHFGRRAVAPVGNGEEPA
jgi:EmrB/QacA subfamily drug resistance transporter